jgi:ATP-dependent RNA helicase DDX10/DBP4
MVGMDDEDDGYISPEFNLPSGSEEELPPTKRSKTGRPAASTSREGDLEDEEQRALELIHSRRL